MGRCGKGKQIRTCGWMLTVMGEMLLLKPGTEGAMGLARCRNSSESIAILKGGASAGGRERWMARVEGGGLEAGER